MATLSLSRSKQELESQGYLVAICERWNQWAHIRQDQWGMNDLEAIRADIQGVTGIQAVGEDIQFHIKKLLFGFADNRGKVWPPNPCLPVWLASGNRFFIWAWRKRGDRGKRKTWELKEIEFVLKNSEVVAQEIPHEDAQEESK